MSLITLIRDYVDVANSTEQLDGYTLSSLAYHTIAFLFTVIKQALVYCFTFHWLRDLSYFCLTPPSLLSSFSNVNGIEDQPLHHLLAFSDSNFSTGIGLCFLGFFNGCFSCMHLSAAHLVTIQRMLVQGVPAGLCSAFGTALGQFVFLACVLFGFRGLLLPWLALEPLHFLVGIGILLSVASSMAQDRRTLTVQWSAKSSLLIYAGTSFLLAWCEQTALFQWMGNLSFGAEPTFVETAPFLSPLGNEPINSIFGNVHQLAQNSICLLSFFLGSLIGASFIGFLLQRFLEFVLRQKGIAVYYGLIKQANLPLATFIFAFGFGSLPYYGFDYLITKGFGFVPHEHFFQQTLFSPINLISKTSQAKEPSQGRLEDQLALLFTLEGEKSKSFAVDTTPFDDGQYLKASQKRPQAFEDLNYRGEHLWTNRLSRISNIREQANQTQSSFLGPVFSWMRSFLWGDGPSAVNTTHDKIIDPYSKTSGILNEYEAAVPEALLTSINEANGTIGEQAIDQSISGVSEKGLRSWGPNSQRATSPSGDRIDGTLRGTNSAYTYDNRKRTKELSPEREQVDNYVKEFDRQFDKGFSNFYDADPHSLIEVEDQWQEKRIKEKCYTNPIYTFLLNTEIDAFLARQPNSHWLSPQEESLLLKRRQLLGNYYDTLALTSQLSTSQALEQLVPKSYANSIYNHQFKGTLKVARRLFSVKRIQLNDHRIGTKMKEPSEESLGDTGQGTHEIVAPKTGFIGTGKIANNRNANQSTDKTAEYEKARVVKFDQPLFAKEKTNAQKTLFHEELSNDLDQLQKSWASTFDDQTSKPIDSLPLRGTNSANKSVKAENRMGLGTQSIEKNNIFLLEQAKSSPLYAGWDEQLRKLIITNRFQNRALAGYNISQLPASSRKNEFSTVFTTWPIPNPNPLRKNNNDFLDTIAKGNTIFQRNSTKVFNEVDTGESLELNSSGSVLDDNLPTDEALLSQKNKERVSTERNKSMGLGMKKQQNSSNSAASQAQKGRENADTIGSFPEGTANRKNSFFLKNYLVDSPKNRFLFQTESAPITNDMVNALLQWQKLIKENKQLSKEDKQAAKEKVSYWPENIHRANWSNELIDNDVELDEPAENVLKKQTFLWEFTPPYHGGFVWPGQNWNY